MAEKKKSTIVFVTDNNEKIEFEVLEQTTINGNNYLLVCDSKDEESAYILKEISINEEEVIYDEVVDDIELQAVAKVFEELLEDCDIQ